MAVLPVRVRLLRAVWRLKGVLVVAFAPLVLLPLALSTKVTCVGGGQFCLFAHSDVFFGQMFCIQMTFSFFVFARRVENMLVSLFYLVTSFTY